MADRTRELGLLLDAREALVHDATRRRNRLHAHFQGLVPGYGERIDRLVSDARGGRKPGFDQAAAA